MDLFTLPKNLPEYTRKLQRTYHLADLNSSGMVAETLINNRKKRKRYSEVRKSPPHNFLSVSNCGKLF
jgi:hypothetical protein